MKGEFREGNQKSHRKSSFSISNNMAISIVLIVVILGASFTGLMLYSSQQSNHSIGSTSTTVSTTLENVTVFGFVSTTGEGTHPTALVFASLSGNHEFIAPVSEGHFSIGLPNQETYIVSARWAGNYSWQSGEILQGQLAINMSEGSMMAQSYNANVATPNTLVTLSGSAIWQIITFSPSSIKFTASDGEQFAGSVNEDGTFSITLPNLMTYSVDIGTVNATGSVEWYFAHDLEINAGARIVGLVAHLSL